MKTTLSIILLALLSGCNSSSGGSSETASSSVVNSSSSNTLSSNSITSSTVSSLSSQVVSSVSSEAVSSTVSSVASSSTPAEATSFTTHVMPILEQKCKACHTTNGSGAPFIITDASSTFTYIDTHNLVDRDDSVQSLLLRKPTRQLPHGGGLQLASDSVEYSTIKDWIDEGALDN